jgi:hypothetical protein
MEIKIDQTKQVEAIVRFNRPLSCYEIIELVGDAITKCNRALRKERKNMPFFKRIFKPCDVYRFDHDIRHYFSHDGIAPMQRERSYLLDPEFYPDAKYETRYLLSIIGLSNVYLYFNVIPGVARENQFGTEMLGTETVSCITIKANLKSSLKWKEKQAKFLELLVSIIEGIK